MNKDQTIGSAMLIVSLICVVAYAWLLYGYTIIVLQITAFIAVAGVLMIIAWVGWTMATTPPPLPLEPEAMSTPPTASVTLENKTSQTIEKP